jgi:hypothetical protein
MSNNKSLYLHFLLAICISISYFCTNLHYFVIKAGFWNYPEYIAKLPDKKLKTLHSVWYARCVRRAISFLVRSPLRKNILKLIDFNIPMPGDQGCIIVTCHTPWKRLLVQWCLENKFALLIGGGKWTDRRVIIQRKGRGITELRNLVKHLQLGGRVIIIADVFNNLKNCPVKFLGTDHNASLFPERFAILTKTPIITVIPKLSRTKIEFIAGPKFPIENLKSQSPSLTSQIISFLEREIESNPAIWPYYVK